MKDSEEDGSNGEETPRAVLIGEEALRKAHLDLRELPAARFVSEGDPEVASQVVHEPVEEEQAEAEDQSQAVVERPVVRHLVTQAPLDLEKIAPIDSSAKKKDEVRQLREKKQEKEESLNRRALEATNRGRSPNSRTYIRGILHPRPVLFWFAALMVLAVRVVFLATVILMGLVAFKEVPGDFVWFLLVLPVVAIFYFWSVNHARCRVCGQREFVPSGARKHMKTHSFFGLGPIVSTALHVLLFAWFRCMFCGTAVRIRK